MEDELFQSSLAEMDQNFLLSEGDWLEGSKLMGTINYLINFL